ncbi:MAG: zf-HC2 domain-containing protein [Marinobacter sp.]|nr:zf-HC2 domain-containing protein [Marinobacter sp.]
MLMCKDLAVIASDYIDGELGTGGKLSVRMHLMMCRHCRTFIGQLKQSTVLMAAHSSQQAPADYIARLDEEIHRALTQGIGSNQGDY